MTVVLDTNVMISSFFGGHAQKIIDLWLQEKFTLCLSAVILAEYRAVLEEHVSSRYLEFIVETLAMSHSTLMLMELPLVEIIKEDPSDNRFLECALAANAEYLVSGDHHLLQLVEFKGTKIVPPAEFMRLWQSKSGTGI